GGVYTINAKQAVAVARAIEPSYVVPMHYKTDAHDAQRFGELTGVEEFLRELGQDGLEPIDALKVEPDRFPEEMEVVVLLKTSISPRGCRTDSSICLHGRLWYSVLENRMVSPPTHYLDAVHSVLAAVLIDPDAIVKVSEFVEPD